MISKSKNQTPDEGLEILRELLRLVKSIDERFDQVLAVQGRGPRDIRDKELASIVARTLAEVKPMRCSEIIRRSSASPALAEALRNADVDNARGLGKLLARLEAQHLDGRTLERGPGKTWRSRAVCAVSNDQTDSMMKSGR